MYNLVTLVAVIMCACGVLAFGPKLWWGFLSVYRYWENQVQAYKHAAHMKKPLP